MTLDPWEIRGVEHLPLCQFKMNDGTSVVCPGEHAMTFFEVVREAWLES